MQFLCRITSDDTFLHMFFIYLLSVQKLQYSVIQNDLGYLTNTNRF